MLSVWLPLNGDLHNQGLSNITTTNNGATVDNNGKIGKCYSFDGNDDFISISCLDLYNTFSGGSQPFSIAFWVYHADTTRAVIFGDFGLSGTIDFNIELTAGHQVRFYWDGTPDKVFNANSSVGINTWTHIIITYDGNEICIYKNGVQQSDKYSGTLAAKSKTSGVFYLGRDYRTGTTALNGKINDFRIYDHCLSPRECKQVSTALVLHYPLAMPGQENLLLNTATPVSWITTHTNADEWSTKDIYNMESPVNQLFEANDTATFSFDWEFTPGSSGSITGNFRLETGNVAPWILGSVSKSTGTRNNASNYIDLSATNTSGHVTCTFIVSSSAASAADTFRYFRIMYDKTPKDGTLKLSNCKLERGSTATPWVPNPADAAYSTLGFNDGIEYDVSGYGYNGTKTGAFAYDADTPRYNVSTFFKAGDGIFGHPNITLSQFTIAFWGKHTVIGKMLFGSNSSSTNNNSDWYWYGDKSFKFPLGEFYYSHNAGSDTDLLNTWTHFVAIYNGEKLVIYRNGIYEGEKAFTGNVTLQDISIGRGLSSDYWEDGFVSDFRIYATALSADDVMALYHTPISLANNGTLLTQGEYVES